MKRIAERFGLRDIVSVEELKKGHVNRTFLATCGGGKFILQTLNRAVFPNPEAVMKNISLIEKAFENEHEIAVPRYLSGDFGNFTECGGEIWRAYEYIESRDEYSEYDHGYAAGRFLKIVNSCDIEFETPIALHDFDFPELPKRNIHGDTKADNIIFGKIPTVIDLDTAMRGYICADYGDMIRSVTTKNFDISSVYEVTRGFADGIGGILTDGEKNSLYRGIILIVTELAERYRNGNREFPNKTHEQCFEREKQLLIQLDRFYRYEDDIINIINDCFR